MYADVSEILLRKLTSIVGFNVPTTARIIMKSAPWFKVSSERLEV